VTSLYIQNPTEILNQIDVQYQMKFPEDLDNIINPYSQKVFEESPLNRVVEQAAPGSDWAVGNGHTIKFEYHTNINNDNVRLFQVNFPTEDIEEPQLNSDGYYQANQLYKTITKDENWTTLSGRDNTVEEFKNKQGQVILKRGYNENQTHDTYYVYDD